MRQDFFTDDARDFVDDAHDFTYLPNLSDARIKKTIQG